MIFQMSSVLIANKIQLLTHRMCGSNATDNNEQPIEIQQQLHGHVDVEVIDNHYDIVKLSNIESDKFEV